MTDLPAGWEWASLGEISETMLGKMLDRGKGVATNPVPYLRNVNVQWGSIDTSDVNTMHIHPDECEHYRLEPGDLLVCEGGEVGRCAIWSGSKHYMAFQKALHRIRPRGAIAPEYLRYLFEHLSMTGTLASHSTGSTIKHLPQEQLRRLQIPIPPLVEQRRIVAALEDHLATLERGRDSVKSARARLARWSESVAETLLRDVAPRKRLGGLIQEPLRNGHSTRASSDGRGIRTLTLTAVTNNEFTESNTKITTASASRVADLWLRAGDILVERSNTPNLVGTSAIYSGPEQWAIFPDLLIRVRVNEELVPEFAALALASRRVRGYFRRSAKGLAGSMPKIDQNTILNAEIPVPALDQQRRIVSRAAFMRSSLESASDTLSKTSKRSHELRRALLTEAFAGRLVPQDPGDEPAAELLGRIRAERAAEPKRRTRRAVRPVQKETLL